MIPVPGRIFGSAGFRISGKAYPIPVSSRIPDKKNSRYLAQGTIRLVPGSTHTSNGAIFYQTMYLHSKNGPNDNDNDRRNKIAKVHTILYMKLCVLCVYIHLDTIQHTLFFIFLGVLQLCTFLIECHCTIQLYGTIHT